MGRLLLRSCPLVPDPDMSPPAVDTARNSSSALAAMRWSLRQVGVTKEANLFAAKGLGVGVGQMVMNEQTYSSVMHHSSADITALTRYWP